MAKYEICKGIWIPNAVKTIRKSDNFMQPIFEAITNSIEAIQEKFTNNQSKSGKITVSIYLIKNELIKNSTDFSFERITIKDNGIGINDKCYNRLITLRDNRKGYSNKGTGRIQYLHSFTYTKIESAYKKNEKRYKLRKITLSKNDEFYKNNAIVRLEENRDIPKINSYTIVSFEKALDSKQAKSLANMTLDNYKIDVLNHFLAKFCGLGDQIPKIVFNRFENEKHVDEKTIVLSDIPKFDNEKKFEINYSIRKSKNGIEKTNNKKSFCLRCFKFKVSKWDKNIILLVSKGELANEISLSDVNANDSFDGYRFLFLLSSDYFDSNDSDTRGEIKLVSEKDFKQKDSDLFIPNEVILLDNIEDKTNEEILKAYPVIAQSKQKRIANLDVLQKMFLLSPSIIDTLKNKIKATDTDEEILRKVYTQEMSEKAGNDAKIKQEIEKIRELDPSESSYQEKLQHHINDFTKLVPVQNRTAITQYVARRKLVLEVFDELLQKNRLANDKSDKVKENLFHNLFFKQHSESSEQSDMWLLNEDFVYFSGVSEHELSKVEIAGTKLLKQNLSDKEREYKDKMNQDAGKRRPDVLLFPEEGKCIIVEYKAPEVNVAVHLYQINRYASLIHNLCDEKFHFDTFYGYYIGENIDVDEILDVESSFVEAYKQNFIFRPYYRIRGKFDKNEGSLYTEIIKYSDILERAKRRNKIFIDLLSKPLEKETD